MISHGSLGSRPSNRSCLARVRQGVKAVLEEVLQEEMTQHLEAGYRELTPKNSSGIHRSLLVWVR
jgi:transposase-like protein